MPEASIYEKIDACAGNLKLDFSGRELATIASDQHYAKDQLKAVSEVLNISAPKSMRR